MLGEEREAARKADGVTVEVAGSITRETSLFTMRTDIV
jgi:hypothetical protein